MGLYGSPDLSKKYGSPEDIKEAKKKRKLIISTQVIVLIVLYLILMVSNENRFIMTVSYIGVLSMVYFFINFAMTIVKLIKKQSVNKEVIKLFICIITFIICGILL